MRCGILALVLAICSMAGATAPDVNVTIRSDALNSAADVYTAAGALKAGGILGNMTTANLKSFLPKAYNACPDCPLGYQLLVVTAPVAKITDESATAHVSGAALNLTAQKGECAVDLLTMSMNASVGLSFSHDPAQSGDFIKIIISVLSFNFDIVESALGPIPTVIIKQLDPILNLILKSFAVPYINKLFPGFPLPAVQGFKITDALIATHKDSIGVSLDISPTAAAFHQQKQMQLPGILKSLPPGFSGPGVITTVGGAGLTKVLQALVPELVQTVNGMTIPAMSGKASGVEYSINSIKLSGFAIGSATVSFATGKGLVLNLSGLSLTIPSTGFTIKKKIAFVHVHCSGHMSGALASASVSEAVNITSQNGNPHISQAKGDWNFGSLSVHEKMDHTACKVIQNIASWFTGNINKLIQNKIQAMIPSAVDGIIASSGNKVLSQLVTTKHVDKWAAVNFYLTQNPTSVDNSLELDLSGQFVKVSAATQRLHLMDGTVPPSVTIY